MPDTNRTASGVLGGLAGLVGLSAVAGVLVTATVTPAIAVTGNAATSAMTMFDQLPSVLDIDTLMLPTTFYAKADGTGDYVELATFYDQNRSPVTMEQINPVMFDAILSSEDPRYYEHGGVDLIGTTRAILSNLRGGAETQGGSSISQQYVKNVLVQRCESTASEEARTQLWAAAEKAAADASAETGTEVAVVPPTADELIAKRDEINVNCFEEATNARGTEGIQRKLQEMRYAIALEQKYSKNDILLGYLNIANFGGTTYGIDAAAQRYFSVSAADLSISQAATLAGLVQNPNRFRIDLPGGSIFDLEGNGYNKAPDQSLEDVNEGTLAALDNLLADGTITEEQYLIAGDGYSATKGRQLYVLSRMFDDGKITEEQYVAAAIEPITPKLSASSQGCVAAKGAEYFCQYVRSVVENDPAFGTTLEERQEALRQGGLKVYTTLDWRVQNRAQTTMKDVVPTKVDGFEFGSAAVSLEATTGRVLAIAQNTTFNETNPDPGFSSIVFAGDGTYGASGGFNAGSTFKLFTLIDWLEKGNSVREVLNGRAKIIDRVTNSCEGDWVNLENDLINNFDRAGGFFGTPMDFTRTSLNTGYFAMAERLDLCDIEKVAAKMGVTRGNGDPAEVNTLFSIIGDADVSPMAMASAYATVANNGVRCEPRVIDRIVDADGNERPLPERECSQVLDPKVAATAAFALEGVMAGGGTGASANPYDGTPLIGKTGTHEESQTWMIESSTKVTTAAWVGNIKRNTGGEYLQLRRNWHNGVELSQMRYILARDIQGVANSIYGGDRFAAPDGELTRPVLADLPNVVGLTVGEATKVLQDAGFEVVVGSAVDAAEARDIVVSQDPPAGKTAGGTAITIRPSNGQGVSIPDVSGTRLDRALDQLRSAGFGSVLPGQCVQDDNAENGERATSTRPGAGTVVNRNSTILVDYTSRDCGGGSGPGNGGGDD
jgi:membrane peptidoglycan carboxypeptidase